MRVATTTKGLPEILFALQILQLVEEGRTDLLQEMLGQRLEFGGCVLGLIGAD